MKLKLTTNIGTVDQKRLGLEGKCLDGCTVDATDEAGKELVARGCAVALPQAPEPKPDPEPADDKPAKPAKPAKA